MEIGSSQLGYPTVKVSLGSYNMNDCIIDFNAKAITWGLLAFAVL